MKPITRLILPVLAYSHNQFRAFQFHSPKEHVPYLRRISGPTAGLGIEWRHSVLIVLPGAASGWVPLAIEEWFCCRRDRLVEIPEAELLDGSWVKRWAAICCSKCGRFTGGETRWPGANLEGEICQECWEHECSGSWWKIVKDLEDARDLVKKHRERKETDK